MAASQEKRKPGRPSNPIGRPKLIELARGVFAKAGYAAASLSRIADAAGIRKASLYHHFDTKEALYLAVLDTVVTDLQEVFIAAMTGSGTFASRLDEASGIAFTYLAEQPEASKILLREMVDGGPFVQAHGAGAINVTLNVGAQFFQAGMDAGEFQSQDPKQLTLAVAGMCLFLASAESVSKRLFERNENDASQLAAQIAFVQSRIAAMAIHG